MNFNEQLFDLNKLWFMFDFVLYLYLLSEFILHVW